MPGYDNRNPSAPGEQPVIITSAPRQPRPPRPGPTPPPPPPRSSQGPSNRALFRIGAVQMVLTIVVVIVLNIVARRLGLNFWGSVVLCAVVALMWPFVASKFRRR